MIIRFAVALPCGCTVQDQSAHHDGDLCGLPAFAGIATPSTGGAWELLPACSMHLEALVAASGSVQSVPTRHREQIQ